MRGDVVILLVSFACSIAAVFVRHANVDHALVLGLIALYLGVFAVAGIVTHWIKSR